MRINQVTAEEISNFEALSGERGPAEMGIRREAAPGTATTNLCQWHDAYLQGLT